jgi:hypothetical protein
MATINDLETNTTGSASRTIINDNFDNLNSDKAEVSGQTLTGQIDWSQTDSFGLKIQSLTTVQRDLLTPANGHIIYNTTTTQFEIYEAGAWESLRASASNASTTVKGIAKLSTAPADAENPIAVGNNDPRVPTTDENDALAGTSGSPSSSNKYVTADDVTEANTASKVVRRDSNSDVLVATTPTDNDAATSKTYVDGEVAKTNQLASNSFSNISVASTTTETDLFSYTVPANTLGTDNILDFKIYCQELEFTSGQSATFRLKYGSTTIASKVLSASNIGNCDGIIQGMIGASGATNSQYGVFNGNFHRDDSYQGANTRAGEFSQDGTASEDSTGALDLKVTVQFSNSGASDEITALSSVALLIRN